MIKFIDVIGNNFEPTNITKKVNGAKVEIKSYISVDTFAEIVNTVTDSCFNESGEYCPEFREVVRRYVILDYFTDIDVENITLKEVFKTSQSGNWFETIERAVTNMRIWSEIENAVDKKIEYRLTPTESAFDRMCNKVTSFLESIPTDTDTNQTLKEVGEVLNKLESVDKDAFVDAVINKEK